jgi:hypothetical protein
MRASAAVVCIGIGVAVGSAARAAESTAASDPEPDIALLEYLGNLVEEHDTLIGPDDMQNPVDPREPPNAPDSDDSDSE